jgi:hypothetical protein
MSPSIAVVIPYFGRWDEWAPLFFETVRRNATVEFVVFTDCDMQGLTAPNVRVQPMSLREYVALVNERLGLGFDPPDAYKLCDLRPLLGRIHEPEFRGFDFYGWCDTDLLFGDVRSFYTDDVLARHDVLSTHAHRISGHFALFRNNRRNRGMYRRIYAWRDALSRPEFVGIDEHGITNAYLMTAVDKANEKFGLRVSNPMTRWLARRRRRGLFMQERYTTPFLPRPWLDGSLDSAQPDVWYYRDGRVTNSRDAGRDFIYLHFMNFKSSRWRHDGTPAPWEGLPRVCRASVADMTRGIVIDRSGIHPIEADEP